MTSIRRKSSRGSQLAPRSRSVAAKPRPNRRAKLDKRSADELTPTRGAGIRVILVGIAFALGAAVVLYRAFSLQIDSGSRYADIARRQSVSKKHVQAKRGVIKDRHGAELAISVDVDSIFAEPRRLSDPAGVAKKLAPILGLKKEPLAKRLGSDRAFVYLRRRVAADVSAKVAALKITGIGARQEPKRFYSNRRLASHVLGFTNLEGAGVAGIERRFAATLKGRSYEVPSLQDALGNKVLSDGFVPQAVLEGDDVLLTIDRHIQYVAEVELEQAVKDNGGVAGMAVVLVPGTGEVLALASYPDFNPNNLAGTGADEHLNRVVSAVYEPGSTMKLVTIAAGLAEGVIEPDSKIDCEGGKWRVGNKTIGDAQHEYGLLTVSEVMKHSSNICAAKIGFGLGRDGLHRWLGRFGFGVKTGIELPGELRGLIRPADEWRDIALANIAFGQGLSVTALQVAQAAGVIANAGVRVPPRIVRATMDKAGQSTPIDKPEATRVLSAALAKVLTGMMVQVTGPGGTAPKAAIPGFDVAGKTGTSQKIDPVTKAYSRSLYVASFVGFVPADDPEVVVLVVVDEPKRSIYGGTVAAPAFRRIATAALSTLGTYPDDPEGRRAFLEGAKRAPSLPPAAQAALMVVEGIDDEADAQIAIDSGLSEAARALLGMPVDLAEAVAIGQRPQAPTAWEGGGAARLGEEGDLGKRPKRKGRMPNFAGLRVREVLNRSADVDCDLVLTGTGRVVKQTPRPGTIVEQGGRCELTLAPKG